MDLRQLRGFLTVAETGNVTQAAAQLHLVQPAVSRQIRLLEKDLGVELFERGRHGMALTDAGRSLVGYARRAMLELERARAELSSQSEGVTGIVTIGLLPSICDVLASRLVSAMAHDFAGIQVRIAMGYAGTLQAWLENGEVDTALIYDAKPSQAIQTQPLVEEDLWIVGPLTSKLRKDKPVPLSSLASQPFVLPSAPHGIRTLVEHACTVAGVQMRIVAETNAMSVQKGLVRAGHGLTILPAIAVADEIARKLLRAAPLKEPTIKRTIVLGLPSNRPIASPVRCAVSTLIRCVKEVIDRGDWLEGRWVGG
ncbi:MAG: LysR substrate-binding domain-containing protein [Rubrivivax sp.]